MTSQLTLYNGALGIVGQARLSALTEDTENRRILDEIWNEGAVKACLEQGMWNFAMRSVRVDADDDVTPSFGFQMAFSKPSDWVRTYQLASDEYFHAPLVDVDYVDEGEYWYSDTDPIYVRYVSNASAFGADLSLWPQSFVLYFQYYLAVRIAPRVKQDMQEVKAIMEAQKRALVDARSKDAMNEGAKFAPIGSWARSRRGRQSHDRGSRSRLIG